MFYKDLSNWLTKQLLPIEPDPRLDNYPLMSTWTITALISLTYIIGVYIWRMKIIQRINMDRQRKQPLTNKELNYRKIENTSMITYFMIFYNFSCIELPNPNDKRTDKLVYYGYLYFLSKFIEMIDTGLFLYRKKVDQVTFLHVFHHASMPPSVWWGLKYAPAYWKRERLVKQLKIQNKSINQYSIQCY
ncbi:Elongation of very long chain fatty acids protein 1 [Schistosoma japonicum]|nr:Elongation of very long chain fatty acids protein 1 [Schistosoma japonicum]